LEKNLKVEKVTIDLALEDLFGLLEGDALLAIQSLPQHVRDRFFDFLCCGFISGGLRVSPPSDFSPATGTDDGTIIGCFVWNREFIAAALRAAQSDGYIPSHRITHGLEISPV
jgi:hypothetical protein